MSFKSVEDRRRYQRARYWADVEASREIGRMKWHRRKQAYERTLNYAAREAVRNAVKHGRIVKPDACTRCGTVDVPLRIHGHHPDHSQPLQVEWLCSRCHGRESRMAA